MAKQKKHEPLTGDALVQKVKTLATLSKTQKAKACGYYTVTKGGVERVNLLQFLKALIEAEGIAVFPQLRRQMTTALFLRHSVKIG